MQVQRQSKRPNLNFLSDKLYVRRCCELRRSCATGAIVVSSGAQEEMLCALSPPAAVDALRLAKPVLCSIKHVSDHRLHTFSPIMTFKSLSFGRGQFCKVKFKMLQL